MIASAESALSRVFVGVDVAKKAWDVDWLPPSKSLTLVAGESGLAKLRVELVPLGPWLIVTEASGGCERELAAELIAARHGVAVVNPPQVRDFAHGVAKLAKTDRQNWDLAESESNSKLGFPQRPAFCNN